MATPREKHEHRLEPNVQAEAKKQGEAKEGEAKEVEKFAFQSYHCGDPNDRTVYCCGLDQRPPENVQHFNTGK